MKTVKIRKDSKTGECYLKLKDFEDILDVKKVKSYTLEPVDDERDRCLILKFYDSKGKVINVKEPK